MLQLETQGWTFFITIKTPCIIKHKDATLVVSTAFIDFFWYKLNIKGDRYHCCGTMGIIILFRAILYGSTNGKLA